MHWVLAEAICAAAALHLATGRAEYEDWYRRWWDHATHLSSTTRTAPGSTSSTPTYSPPDTVWPGRPDLYHSLHAVLLPRLPLNPGAALALTRILTVDRLSRRVHRHLPSRGDQVPRLQAPAGPGAGRHRRRRSAPRTAVDLFTGTTRVAQEFKRRGIDVTATDLGVLQRGAQRLLHRHRRATGSTARALVASSPGSTRSRGGRATSPGPSASRSRFFQPHNGARIDAIRDAIERDHPDGPLRPILLTSLLLAADRVDSTTGLQMAYLKQWAPRSHRDLELQVPELLAGPGHTVARRRHADGRRRCRPVDLMYLDPPYNQHRYFTNYHVWETLVRWDEPEHYGIACKRVDARDDEHPERVQPQARHAGGAGAT